MRPGRERERGLSVVELSVAAGLFLVITTILVSALFQAVKVWKLGDQRTNLINSAKAVFADVGWELESSHLHSVELDQVEGILTFVSPFGSREGPTRDAFLIDPASGNLKWSKYVVIFHHSASSEIRKRELLIPAGAPAENSPLPLSLVDIGFGARPLTFYVGDGRVLSRHVSEFAVERIGRTVELSLKLESDERSFQFVTSTMVRN